MRTIGCSAAPLPLLCLSTCACARTSCRYIPASPSCDVCLFRSLDLTLSPPISRTWPLALDCFIAVFPSSHTPPVWQCTSYPPSLLHALLPARPPSNDLAPSPSFLRLLCPSSLPLSLALPTTSSFLALALRNMDLMQAATLDGISTTISTRDRRLAVDIFRQSKHCMSAQICQHPPAMKQASQESAEFMFTMDS